MDPGHGAAPVTIASENFSKIIDMRRSLSLALSLALLPALGCGLDGTADEGFPAEDDGNSYNSYCDPQADWDSAWAQFEADVVVLVNERRAEGADCGGAGSFGPADPVVAEAQLRCAARLHSQDMGVNGYFDHTNLQGESPWDRVDMTDYEPDE